VGTYEATKNHGATIAFRKTAVGGEQSVVVTRADGGPLDSTTAQVLVYRGVDPLNPIEQVSSVGTQSAGNTSITSPGVSTLEGGDELVIAESAAEAPPKALWTPPSGMTARVDNSSKGSISQLADQACPNAGSSGPRTATISGPGQLEAVVIALRAAPRELYFLHDQQGSTRGLADPAGDVVATYRYNPFGETVAGRNLTATPLRYDGQYEDDESGLYYLDARYYDPGVGQFITRDPAENLTSVPYGYSADDPLDGADPTGMCSNPNYRIYRGSRPAPPPSGQTVGMSYPTPWNTAPIPGAPCCAGSGWVPYKLIASFAHVSPAHYADAASRWDFAGVDNGACIGTNYCSSMEYVRASSNLINIYEGCEDGMVSYGWVGVGDLVHQIENYNYSGDIDDKGGGQHPEGVDYSNWKPGPGYDAFQPGYHPSDW
jgi:RHS repeat-associated protein